MQKGLDELMTKFENEEIFIVNLVGGSLHKQQIIVPFKVFERGIIHFPKSRPPLSSINNSSYSWADRPSFEDSIETYERVLCKADGRQGSFYLWVLSGLDKDIAVAEFCSERLN